MLQHWPWLVAETANDLDATDHNSSPRHPNLAQTEAYAERFFDNGTDFSEESYFHFRPLETVKRAAYFSNDLTEGSGFPSVLPFLPLDLLCIIVLLTL